MDSGRSPGPHRRGGGFANGPDCFRLSPQRQQGLSTCDGHGNAHLRLPDKGFSNRKVETATYDSIAFRFIAGNTYPDNSCQAYTALF